jgi:hypothetical protein
MLCHTNLIIYYQHIFILTQHKYSVTEIEDMIPYERDLYTDMLNAHIAKLEEMENRDG